MKLVSDHRQSQELRRLKEFPESDMVMEFFWASDHHPYHLSTDEKFIQHDEDVDIIPAWSLGCMIGSLPPTISYIEEDNIDEQIQYDLQINPDSDGNVSYVRYTTSDNSLVLLETKALTLLDAVFAMIMKLKEWDWYE